MRTNIDQVLDKINILDVVSQYVKLRKAGKDYIGLCPFHKEKTPSFTVSIDKQIYYCFGCHEGGNAINFIIKYENLSFQEALEALAGQYGIKLEQAGNTKRPKQHDALARLVEHYHDCLKSNPSALRYLSDRGLNQDGINEFKIGFSDRQRYSMRGFLKSAHIPDDILLGTGILRMKDGDIYDIFRGRIVIPIFDVTRKVVGFGARAMEKDAIPKYINSPESSIFSKRFSLFGIDKAKKYITEKNEVFIVEGYFDLIALYLNGIKNVVSTLGTSITEGQLSKLRNYTENITLMLDGDEAGVKSALRLIGILSEMDINGSMIVLPDGHDPDSFVREKGTGGLDTLSECKKPILDYFFDYYMARCKLDKLEGKLTFIKTVTPHVETIRDGIKKRLYIQRLSELTGVEEEHFFDSFKGTTTTGQVSKPTRKDTTNIIEKRVVGVLINNPSLIHAMNGREVIKHVKNDDIKEVLKRMFEYFEEKKQLEINSFIGLLDNTNLRDFVVQSALDVAECDETESKRILSDYLKHVEKKYMKEEAERITERLSEAERNGNDKKVMELLQQKKQVLAFIKSHFV
ncbi:MAG: DNA primase [Syntrophobacterales bacterium]|jgi:DNA primase|nr:DNA primase [Syntrophobacterales bacterium]